MTPQEILDASCAAFGVKTSHLLEGGRTPNYTDARAVAAYLMRNLNGLELKEIGAVLNRSTCTTWSAIQRAKTWADDKRVHPFAYSVIKAITTLNSQAS